MKIHEKIIFVSGYTCEIEGTNNANVFVTIKWQFLCQYWKSNIYKVNFLIRIEDGKNRGKFDNGTGQVAGGCSNFGRAGNRIAAKVQFQYARKRIVTSRIIWLHNPNKIAGFEVSIGRWRPFGSTVQGRYVFFQPPVPDGIGVSVCPCIALAMVKVTISPWLVVLRVLLK